MQALCAAVMAAVLMSSTVQADQIITWSSVIYNRMGERTPEDLGTLETLLTSTGAQQSYAAGQFFRDRYLTSSGVGLEGMSRYALETDQLYVLALDQQTSVASAQAFVQGLYPPYTLLNSSSLTLDPTSITASGTYVEAPLNGYQYPYIHVSGALDPDYIFLGGNLLCPAYDESVSALLSSSQYQAVEVSSASVYQAVGPLLQGVLESAGWNFGNAYAIYDYISYQAAHNATMAMLLQQSEYIDPATGKSYLYTLQWLADQQQQMELANLTAYNSVTKSSTLPETAGSISTIAGNMLAVMMLSRLQLNIESLGDNYKLSLLFGDFEPMVSLFALMSMAHTGSNFTGLPQYASSAVFELFSWGNATDVSFPEDTSELYVAFSFRNGTDNGTTFYEYPVFNLDPDETVMSWSEFQSYMTYAALGDVGTWCLECGAENLFCAAWNTSLTYDTTATTSTATQMSPAAAGAIGAAVALVIAALLFALVMLFGRIRFHRRPRRNQSDLGGYKGSDKLASDRDLTLPKSGIVVGTRAADDSMTDPATGHERTGSWEMKDAEAGQKLDSSATRKASFEHDDYEDELQVNPFSDPVKAHEQV